MRLPIALCITSCVTVGGCAVESSPTIGSSDQLGRKINGRKINGRKINGRKINGSEFNGTVTSINLANVSLGGQTLGDVVLTDSEFSSEQASASGEDFVGAKFEANLDDGNSVTVRIDDIAAIDDDLNHYWLSYETDEGWRPLCGNDNAGDPISAVPLEGVWNMQQGVVSGGSHSFPGDKFTFGCYDGAVGKCANYGYVPWRTVGGESLMPQHETCVRALRADYCGDGRTWTTNGHVVNLYDSAGISDDTENWLIEAEWTPDGAVCMTQERVLQLQLGLDLGGLLPLCILENIRLDCGAPYNLGDRALQMTEVQLLGILGL